MSPTPPLQACPVDAALEVIRGRWKGTILWRLEAGPLRTSQLHRSIPGVSERMLIRHLRELVEDGILERHDAGTVPPHVTYSLTDYGATLAPVVWSLCAWGEIHLQRSAQRPAPHRAAGVPTRGHGTPAPTTRAGGCDDMGR